MQKAYYPTFIFVSKLQDANVGTGYHTVRTCVCVCEPFKLDLLGCSTSKVGDRKNFPLWIR
jgi:hypothetical protein